MKNEVKRCPECNAPLDWDMLTGGRHDRDICISRQLIQTKAEIKKLKASVDSWKDAWYQLRDIIGWLWWYHPAIASEASRSVYQNNQKIYEARSE